MRALLIRYHGVDLNELGGDANHAFLSLVFLLSLLGLLLIIRCRLWRCRLWRCWWWLLREWRKRKRENEKRYSETEMWGVDHAYYPQKRRRTAQYLTESG